LLALRASTTMLTTRLLLLRHTVLPVLPLPGTPLRAHPANAALPCAPPFLAFRNGSLRGSHPYRTLLRLQLITRSSTVDCTLPHRLPHGELQLRFRRIATLPRTRYHWLPFHVARFATAGTPHYMPVHCRAHAHTRARAPLVRCTAPLSHTHTLPHRHAVSSCRCHTAVTFASWVPRFVARWVAFAQHCRCYDCGYCRVTLQLVTHHTHGYGCYVGRFVPPGLRAARYAFYAAPPAGYARLPSYHTGCCALYPAALRTPVTCLQFCYTPLYTASTVARCRLPLPPRRGFGCAAPLYVVVVTFTLPHTRYIHTHTRLFGTRFVRLWSPRTHAPLHAQFLVAHAHARTPFGSAHTHTPPCTHPATCTACNTFSSTLHYCWVGFLHTTPLLR